jgi:pimeloyl-ACP methyl ester carboxylesterase
MKLLLPVMLGMSICCAAQTPEYTYRTPGDTLNNYYAALRPDSASKGLLLIIPGFGTTPAEMMMETQLPVVARTAGYTVVIPYLVHYEIEDTFNVFEKRLESLVPELLRKYQIPAGRFIIGGHSLGGHQALYYAEMAFKPGAKLLQPAAVFGVDPPLDMKRLYDGYARVLKTNTAKHSEPAFVVNRFKNIYGGTPAQRLQKYVAVSSFSRHAPQGGNARYLKAVPVRLYCDPDVNWHITERNTPIEWTNLADMSACIVQLRTLGNTRAELVTALGKGYWSNGQRHPHAFSILDPHEFILWMQRIFEAN